MDVVAALHGDDGSGRGEHVVAADGTVTLGCTLYTAMGRGPAYGYADIALLGFC